MAKVLTAEQFRQCPQGTVFAYGPRWAFSPLLILEEIIPEAIGPFGGQPFWGFWATNPMGVEGDDLNEDVRMLEEMVEAGASYPADTSCSKYMSYDTDGMEFFLVLERADWEALCNRVQFVP